MAIVIALGIHPLSARLATVLKRLDRQHGGDEPPLFDIKTWERYSAWLNWVLQSATGATDGQTRNVMG